MKITEFKKAIKDIGFHNGENLKVTDDNCDFYIESDTEILAAINKSEKCLISTDYQDFLELEEGLKQNLFDIICKFASTSIPEREDEEKYYISSKLTPNDDGRFLFKDYDNIDSLVWGDKRCDNNTFTQKEIDYICVKFHTNLSDFNIEEVKE